MSSDACEPKDILRTLFLSFILHVPTLKYSGNQTYKWLITGLSGLFMFLSLFVYRAYHIDQVSAFTGHSMFVRALVHSLIISAVFYIIEFYASPLLNINERAKPIVTALVATFIGLNLSFLAFNYFYNWTELHWSSYLKFLYEYPLILLIPIILSYLIGSLIELPKKGEDELVTFISENRKEHFQLRPENLLYIKSADNYVEIFHRNNQFVDKRLLRKSLKTIEVDYSMKNILKRCHRSYLVNPSNIDNIHKTATKIELNINGDKIPVSKKYANHFS